MVLKSISYFHRFSKMHVSLQCLNNNNANSTNLLELMIQEWKKETKSKLNVFASQCINQQCYQNWIYMYILFTSCPIPPPISFFKWREKKRGINHNGKEFFLPFVQITINSIETTTTKKGNIFAEEMKMLRGKKTISFFFKMDFVDF